MNMKHVLVLILALTMVLCLCACGGNGDDNLVTEPTDEVTEPITEATEPVEEATDPTYAVTVVDEEGNPVPGAWVQLCLEACVPAMTDENGVASFFLEENDYKVSFTVMPAGYEYSGVDQEWYFADGENTMTIVLKKAA